MRDVREFIGRICELGNGSELIALRCLKKATADENVRVPWAGYEERLKEFLEQMSELPNDYENVEDILNEAVEVVDLYGRLQPDKFREIWEKLNKRLRESKV
jgi:acylphosphatase